MGVGVGVDRDKRSREVAKRDPERDPVTHHTRPAGQPRWRQLFRMQRHNKQRLQIKPGRRGWCQSGVSLRALACNCRVYAGRLSTPPLLYAATHRLAERIGRGGDLQLSVLFLSAATIEICFYSVHTEEDDTAGFASECLNVAGARSDPSCLRGSSEVSQLL